MHRVVELDWWDTHVLPTTERSARIPVTLVPAQHWSARTATDALRSNAATIQGRPVSTAICLRLL